MAAAFLPYGTIHHFIRARWDSGDGRKVYYLGSSVTSPIIDTEKITTPVFTDVLTKIPTTNLYHGEIHTVTVTLNVVDYFVYAILRGRGVPNLRREDTDEFWGSPTIGIEDFELLLLNSPTHTENLGSFIPSGRLYYSVEPQTFRETTENTRLLELTVVFRCLPILRVIEEKEKKQEKPIKEGSTKEQRDEYNRWAQEAIDLPGSLAGQGLLGTIEKAATSILPTGLPGSSVNRVESDPKKFTNKSPLRKGHRIASLYTEVPSEWFR